jgi:hypothetical protein
MAGVDVYSREELCALLYLESFCVVSLLGGDYMLYLILYRSSMIRLELMSTAGWNSALSSISNLSV